MARSAYIYLLRSAEPPHKVLGAFTVKRDAQAVASRLPVDSVTMSSMPDGRLAEEYGIPWTIDPWERVND